jgi:solute carrier family 35, member C2
MTLGVIMMVASETAFNTLGFVLVMLASCSSGFRWSLTQILLLRHPATSNPFSTIMCLAPVIFASLVLIAIPVEGFSHLLIGFYDLMAQRGNIMAVLILLFPGLLAFLMMASEYALLKRTSVVTLSICGIFKEVAMVIAASLVFDDKLTPINVSGLIITICSIGAYNYIKLRRMQEEARIKAHLENEDYSPILATDPDQLNDEAEQATSSSRLMGTTVGIPSGSSSQPATLDSPAKVSPVKRPEDLD